VAKFKKITEMRPLTQKLLFFCQEKLKENSVRAPNGQCILYTGPFREKRGLKYGTLRSASKKVIAEYSGNEFEMLAHRFSKLNEIIKTTNDINSVIESHVECSHLCHNSLCINPEHLSLESQGTNNSRKPCKSQGHCFGNHRDFNGEAKRDCLVDLCME